MSSVGEAAEGSLALQAHIVKLRDRWAWQKKQTDDARAAADRLRDALAEKVDSLANFRECFTDPHDFDIAIADLRAILEDTHESTPA